MFRYAVKFLMKRKVLYSLIILQFTVAFSSIFNFIITKDNIMSYEKDVRKIIDTEKIIFLQGQSFSDISEIYELSKNYLEFTEYLEENTDGYLTYHNDNYVIDLSEEEYEKKDIITNMIGRYNRGDVMVPVISTLEIDGNYEKVIDIPIAEGRVFNEDEFYKTNEENIPIILGNNFVGIYEIGDIIKSVVGNNFKVIGFLKDGFSFFRNGTLENFITDLTLYDYGAIIPRMEKTLIDPIMSYIRLQEGCFYYLSENENREAMIDMIDKKANELQIDVKSVVIEDVLNKVSKERKEDNKDSLYLGLVILVFTVASLAISTLALINYRKREFGILIATGGSIKDIIKILIYEMGIILGVSFLLYQLSNLRFRWRYLTEEYIRSNGYVKNIFYDTGNIELQTYIKVYLVIAMLLILISAIPINRIRKFKPKDLIGGIE